MNITSEINIKENYFAYIPLRTYLFYVQFDFVIKHTVIKLFLCKFFQSISFQKKNTTLNQMQQDELLFISLI